jgi:cobalt-zinc-cadmium efflux system membrane fusion protein
MPATDLCSDMAYATTKAPAPLSPSRQLILLAFVTALIGSGIFLGTGAQPGPRKTSAPNGRGIATNVQLADLKVPPVKQDGVPQSETADGKIVNDDELSTPVFSPYTGRVVKLFARAGDVVHQGDALFAVQAVEFVQGQSELNAAVAALKIARARLSLTEANEKRQHELFVARRAALMDWQQAQAELTNAQGGLNSALVGLAVVRNRLRVLGKTDQEIDAIEQAADVRKLDPVGIVFAPVDGIVVQREAGLAQSTVSGASELFQIGNLSRVRMLADVREDNAPSVHLADPVEVTVPLYPGRVFPGKISRVSPAIDPVLHRLPVWAEVDNPDGILKPEMAARFRFLNDPSPAAPDRSILYDGNDGHVRLAGDTDKTPAVRPINIGRVTEGVARSLDRLNADNKVVTATGED